MKAGDLFSDLDLDFDGSLSRSELHKAADILGWGWRHAPIFAVLDLFIVKAPMSREEFIMNSQMGPYGNILLKSPVFSTPALSGTDDASRRLHQDDPISNKTKKQAHNTPDEAAPVLMSINDQQSADDYDLLLKSLACPKVKAAFDDTALFIIDPQRSFTKGAWMNSIGYNAESEVAVIELAFRNCARLLKEVKGTVETMFSRCPFPPGSYGWDDQLENIIDDDQLYFIKPGNSILWPTTNGFSNWVDGLISRKKKKLVIGGCTLNSCVRISAIEVQKQFLKAGLKVVVDLSLCGGRAGNYKRSSQFNGKSSVESAVREMEAAGVCVTGRVDWA